MKYIIIDNGLNDVPLMFPNIVEHSSMFSKKDQITSAGVFNIFLNKDNEIDVSCVRGSLSLNIKPDTEKEEMDAILIKRAIQKY